MSGITYYYWGDFTRIAKNGPGLGVYGYPVNANNNVYNTDRTQPFVTNQAAFLSQLDPLWSPDDVNNDLPAAAYNINLLLMDDTESVAVYTGPGLAGFNDAFGVSFAYGAPTTTNTTPRFILMPNIHATATGVPNPNPRAMTSGLFLPVPCSVGPFQQVPGDSSDVKGTIILDPTRLEDYFNDHPVGPGTFRPQFFVLPNAWKYDSVAGDWYVDTTIEPFWHGPAAINSDARFHNQRRPVSADLTPPAGYNADLLDVLPVGVALPQRSLGLEDLPLTPIPNPATANLDFNDIVFVPFQLRRPLPP